MNSDFDPSWTTIPEICNLEYLFTVVPLPDNLNLIVFGQDTTPMKVTVGTDSIYYNGDHLTGSYNPGLYAVQVRAWADNDYDTGKFVELAIEIIDPCL